jgi:formamidopyrimidine-DNA glycosylase
MPELPEVEIITCKLGQQVVGRTIRRFHATWERQVKPSISVVQRAVQGATIIKVVRRGKWIAIQLRRKNETVGVLALHLRMSGRIAWEDADSGEPDHVRAVWELDQGKRLLFCDARKFGRIELIPTMSVLEQRLGIEPLGPAFTVSALRALFAKRARRLKPLLLDQTVIAGLGNIYTDEALFRARLHPLERADRLGDKAIRSLHHAVVHVLREAIQNNGTSFDWVYTGGRMQHSLRVYGHEGQPCRRCKTPIVYLRVAQRGTHICPRCQVLGAETPSSNNSLRS